MMNTSLGDLDVTEYYNGYPNATYSHENANKNNFHDLALTLWITITLITCCIGGVGNGYIIRLLGFQIKRNWFTTFIFNLAIADFGYLASVFVYIIAEILGFLTNYFLFFFCGYLIQMMYINANFFLTAISIDRCVAVLFPIWHSCSLPKPLSSTVCVLLWISSFLLCGIMMIMHLFRYYRLYFFHYLVTAIVCLPLTTLSTLVLFIKVCLKSSQNNQGQLLLMILITLLCFLILAFPLSVFGVIITFYDIVKDYNQLEYWLKCSGLLSCLNSGIHPLIYFLVGKKKGPRSKQSMKVILQTVFKEAGATGGR